MVKLIGKIEYTGREDGVAMITVILLTAVLMVMGAGMYVVSSREAIMSTADNTGGQAFSYAEGGIENVMNILNTTATESQLTQLRADQSPDGQGRLMAVLASDRLNPDDPVDPDNAVVMNIGSQTYHVWVDEVDEDGNHCEGCGLNPASNSPAYLQITATGWSGEGYRKLEQRVRLEGSGFPLGFYVNGDVSINGNPTLNNQSMYVRGSVYNRYKMTVTGTDLSRGGNAGVKATGSIYKTKSSKSYIYKSSGAQNSSYWLPNFINDRDSRGPTGNTFTVEELESTLATAGLTAAQLASLKQQAISTGYYNGNASNNLMLQQGDLPAREGDVVIYVEFPSGSPNNNEVNLKFEWPHSPYTTGKALVIVKNGSVKLTGNAIGNARGVVYCPDGEVRADGGGGGHFTGYVWSKGFTDIGNFNFDMDDDFVSDPPFFTWTVTRETAWEEIDG